MSAPVLSLSFSRGEEEDPLERAERIEKPANNGRTANKVHYIAAINCSAVLNLRDERGEGRVGRTGRRVGARWEATRSPTLLETLPVSSYR